MPPRSGSRIGKYELIGQLATGGMGELFLARVSGLEGFEKLVAIKRMRPELGRDPSSGARFLDEARLVASLQHPNVVQVFDVGSHDHAYFFAMEYVHGENLRAVLDAARGPRRLGLDEAITIAIGVCSGLHYAHEKV